MSEKHRHLVLIHQVYAGKNDPGGTRHYELLSRFLRKPATNATVITADSNYLDGKQNTKLQGRFAAMEEQDGIQVLRTRTFGARNRSYVARVGSFLGFVFTSILVGLRIRGVDVVMGTTPPLFQAASAWLL